MIPFDLNLKKTAGWILIMISLVLWGIIVLLPFLGVGAGEIAAATTALVILGEITFWMGLLLAGRQAWDKIKKTFARIFRKDQTL